MLRVTLVLVLLCLATLLVACGDRARQTRDDLTGSSLRAENDIIWQVRSESPTRLLVTRGGSPYRWRTEPIVNAESGFSLRVVIEKLDAQTGTLLWDAEYQLEAAVGSLRIREFDGLSVIAINSTVEARELRTGRVRWSHLFESVSLVPTDEPEIFVYLRDGTLAQLQERSGDIVARWSLPTAPLYAFRCGENNCVLLAEPSTTVSSPPMVSLNTERLMNDGATEHVADLLRVELENVEFHGTAMVSSNQNGTQLDWLLTGEGRGERTDASYFRPFDLLDDETQVAAVAVTRKLGTSLELRVGPAKGITDDTPFVIAPGATSLVDVRHGADGALVALSSDNVLYRFDLERRALTGIVETEFSSNLTCTIANSQRAFTLVQCSDGTSTFVRALRWRDVGARQ